MKQILDALLKAGVVKQEELDAKKDAERRDKIQKKGPEQEGIHHHHLRTDCGHCGKSSPDVEYYEHTNRLANDKWLCMKCADQFWIKDELRQSHQSNHARSGVFRREFGATKKFPPGGPPKPVSLDGPPQGPQGPQQNARPGQQGQRPGGQRPQQGFQGSRPQGGGPGPSQQNRPAQHQPRPAGQGQSQVNTQQRPPVQNPQSGGNQQVEQATQAPASGGAAQVPPAQNAPKASSKDRTPFKSAPARPMNNRGGRKPGGR